MKLFQKLIKVLKKFKLKQVKSLLNGKEINLTGDNTTITSNNFNVDRQGNMNCNNARIVGGSLELGGDSSSSNLILKGLQDDWGEFRAAIFPAGYSILQNDTWNLFEAGVSKVNNKIMGEIQVNDEGYNSNTTVRATGIVTPSVTQTSLEENKKNFEKLLEGLNIVLNTDIYKYNLKVEDEKAKKHIGFVIGDKYNYSKEITSLNNDGVDIYSMVSVAYKAIQEQQEQIEELQAKIKELEDK